MNKKTPDPKISYDYINAIIKNKYNAYIYLKHGIKLEGEILSQDEDGIILTKLDGKDQLVYKNAISTIVSNPRLDYHANR